MHNTFSHIIEALNTTLRCTSFGLLSTSSKHLEAFPTAHSTHPRLVEQAKSGYISFLVEFPSYPTPTACPRGCPLENPNAIASRHCGSNFIAIFLAAFTSFSQVFSSRKTSVRSRKAFAASKKISVFSP